MDHIESIVSYRDIQGYPGYRVGDDGSVWTRYRRGQRHPVMGEWRRLKPALHPFGYLLVSIGLKGTKKTFRLHRLILEAFVGPCPEGMESCHNDGDPLNNALYNLRWDTHASNLRDRHTHGTYPLGERHGSSKLTAEIVREARARFAAGGVTKVQLAREYGVSDYVIGCAIRRVTWTHVE